MTTFFKLSTSSYTIKDQTYQCEKETCLTLLMQGGGGDVRVPPQRLVGDTQVGLF